MLQVLHGNELQECLCQILYALSIIISIIIVCALSLSGTWCEGEMVEASSRQELIL